MKPVCYGGRRQLIGAERIAVLVSMVAAIVTVPLEAAKVRYEVSDLGPNLHRYTYTVSDFQFSQNQELDIRFDPAVYRSLSNGMAGTGFHLVLLQPGNPPGAFGDLSVLALVDNPSLAEPLSVDVSFLESVTPGPQPFFINQFDANGKLVSTVESGLTTVVPEPDSRLLGGLSLLASFAFWAVRRRRRTPEHGRTSSDNYE